MATLKIAYVEWPEGLTTSGPAWQAIQRQVEAARADLLVTHEMPFGDWLAEHPCFDAALAQRSIDAHAQGLAALQQLQVGHVLSSRPVAAGARLVNEAFVLSAGQYRPLHQKHYFPQEPGFFEKAWFGTALPGFALLEVAGAKVGVLLCTELFFNEHARAYGRQGADLIAVPRATGSVYAHWQVAGTMAALVSGAYVVSANRAGGTAAGQHFGGHGFAISPGGQLLGHTGPDATLQRVEIDLDLARAQKSEYPCYVDETPAPP